MKAEKAKPTDNLRPCPFCSSSDHLEIVYVDWVDAPMWCVQCVECNVNGPDADSRRVACQRWNQRITETAATDKDLQPCPFCGASGNDLMIHRGDWRGMEEFFKIPSDSNPVYYGVRCLKCRIGGPTGDTRRESCRRWNGRHFLTRCLF